jgi:hypothetical protein
LTEQSQVWFDRLRTEGKIVDGHPLERDGKIIFTTNGPTVANVLPPEPLGPIGGYVLLHAANLEEAADIAKEFPALPHGAKVELQPVAGECPVAAEVRAEERKRTKT